MATGSDVLLEHLLFQVALSGDIGTSFLRVALLWSHVLFLGGVGNDLFERNARSRIYVTLPLYNAMN